MVGHIADDPIEEAKTLVSRVLSTYFIVATNTNQMYAFAIILCYFFVDRLGVGRALMIHGAEVQIQSPWLQGTSPHNQRIERLWRDVTSKVTSSYIRLFKRWNRDFPHWFPNGLGVLFCLHYLFIPKINEDLQIFIGTWNRHRLSSEHALTPNQLFLNNLHLNGAYPANVDEQYGVDENLIAPPAQQLEADGPNQVELDPMVNPLNGVQYEGFKTHVIPLQRLDDAQTRLDKLVHAINVFLWAYLHL
jgi:hypothetical protein